MLIDEYVNLKNSKNKSQVNTFSCFVYSNIIQFSLIMNYYITIINIHSYITLSLDFVSYNFFHMRF